MPNQVLGPGVRAPALRTARIFAGITALLYAAYLSGLVPGLAPATSVLPQLCISALMAIAVWLPFSSGQLSLAQAGFMATGAYCSAWLTTSQQWSFLPALIAGALSTALFGLLVSYPALRLRGVYLAVATLGLGEMIRIFLLNLEATGGAFGYSGIPRYTQLWHLLFALSVTCLVLYLLMRGRVGRAVWAVRHDEIAAAASGVETTRVRILTFTLGAFVAGLAGGLQAHYVRFIAPDNYGMAALIEWLVFVMLGGSDVFVGAVAGTVVLGTLPELLRFLADWRLLLNGALLVGLLILRPRGIVTRELLGWTFSPRRIPTQHAAQAVPPARTRLATALTPAPADILRVEGVSKSFGGLAALVDVTFSVRRNHIHGLIGPNGAGKTTLFNAVTGLYSIDGGRIVLDGVPIERARPQEVVRRGVARTFQNIRLYGDLTVLENVMLGAHSRMTVSALASALGLDRQSEQAAARSALHLLELLGLSNRAGARAASLSYGDQRRVEIARALASEPELLILDEPVAGMNAVEAEVLATLLRRIRDEFGKTILLIEHDMDLVMGLCEDVTVLNFGHVIASGTPAEIQRDKAVIEAYLGNPEKAATGPAEVQVRGFAAHPSRARVMLAVEQLVVRYGAINAVKGISLRVDAGEMVALIGGNGAGKTSTLLAVSGALPTGAGTVRLDGTPITGLSAYRIARLGIAQVMEGRAVFGGLTVRENLLAGAYARTDTRQVKQDMDAMLQRFPRLRERLTQAGRTLSGGEQQMLAIARALMSRPRILLLDEPSMGLAPLIVEEIFQLLAELNREGLTVLLVEQNAVRALTLSNRAYVMAHGEIVASGDSAALLADKRVLDAYLGMSGDGSAAEGKFASFGPA